VPTEPLTTVTVPAMGARRVVAASAFSALVTLSCALSTLACAAATVVVLVAEPEAEPELEPDPESPLALFDPLVLVALVDADSSAWVSVSCADCRLASACASSTLAVSGSIFASSSSCATCWPACT
jgi:hypothetical protein